MDEAFKEALYGDRVTGTPTLYLNGVRLNNIQNPEALLQSVVEAGAILRANADERTSWLGRLRQRAR